MIATAQYFVVHDTCNDNVIMTIEKEKLLNCSLDE